MRVEHDTEVNALYVYLNDDAPFAYNKVLDDRRVVGSTIASGPPYLPILAQHV